MKKILLVILLILISFGTTNAQVKTLDNGYLLVQGVQTYNRTAFGAISTVKEADALFSKIQNKLDGVTFRSIYYDSQDLAAHKNIAKIGKYYGIDLWADTFRLRTSSIRAFKWYEYNSTFQAYAMQADGTIYAAEMGGNPLFDTLNPEAMNWFITEYINKYITPMKGLLSGFFINEDVIPYVGVTPPNRKRYEYWNNATYSDSTLALWIQYCINNNVINSNGVIVDKFPVHTETMAASGGGKTAYYPGYNVPAMLNPSEKFINLPQATGVWKDWFDFTSEQFVNNWIGKISKAFNDVNFDNPNWYGSLYFALHHWSLPYEQIENPDFTVDSYHIWGAWGKQRGLDLVKLSNHPDINIVVSETYRPITDPNLGTGILENYIKEYKRITLDAGKTFGVMLHRDDSWALTPSEETERWQLINTYQPTIIVRYPLGRMSPDDIQGFYDTQMEQLFLTELNNYRDIPLDNTIIKAPSVLIAEESGSSRVKKLNSNTGEIITQFQAFGSNNSSGSVNIAMIKDINGNGYDDIVTGQVDGESRISVYDGNTNEKLLTFLAFGASNRSGTVRVATIKDLNGNGYDEIVAGQVEGSSRVKVIDGKVGEELSFFEAFGNGNISGSVRIGVIKDINGNGFDDIVTGQEGGTSYINIYDGSTNEKLSTFKAFGGGNTSGSVRFVIGDTDGDGADEIIAGQDDGGTSWVCVFESDGTQNNCFKAFVNGNTRGAVRLALGDVDGDGSDEIIAGHDVGGGSSVCIYEGDGTKNSCFKAFDVNYSNPTGAVRLTATDIDGDGKEEIFTGQGVGGDGYVCVFNGDGTKRNCFKAFDGWNSSGGVRFEEKGGMPYIKWVVSGLQKSLGVHLVDSALTQTNYSQLKNIGSRVIKSEASSWYRIETTQGNFDFTETDYVVNNAITNNLEVVFTLIGPPEWEINRPPGNTSFSNFFKPINLENWRAYCQKVMTRYKGKVKYFEVWNEQNAPDIWFVGGTPNDYVDLVRIANEEAGKIDSEIKIVMGGVTGELEEKLNGGTNFFLSTMQNGLDNYVDIYGIHYTSKNWVKFDWFKSIIKTYGDSSKPIWNTEENIYDGAGGISKIFLTDFYLQGFSRVIYFLAKDQSDPLNPITVGLFDTNGNAKDEYLEFQQFFKFIDINRSFLGSGISTMSQYFTFADKDLDRINIIAWKADPWLPVATVQNGSNSTLTLPGSITRCDVFDYLGNLLPELAAINSPHTITLNSIPKYLSCDTTDPYKVSKEMDASLTFLSTFKDDKRYIRNPVIKPFGDGINLTIPNLPEQTRIMDGYIDVTQPPFNAVGDGVSDDTAALQKAITFSRENQLVTFLPSKTYKVSDTLTCIQGLYHNKNTSKISSDRENPCVIVGSRVGTRPIIKLTPGANGFNDPLNPKYLVHFWARSMPPGDLNIPQPNISFNNVFINIDLDLGENSGAVGIRHRAAQGSGIQETVINATGAYTGIEGGIGSGGSNIDVTVVGGKYGLDLRKTQPAPTITGVSLLGQTENAILYDGLQTLTAVGLKIVVPDGTTGPAIKIRSWNAVHGQTSFSDSEIEFTTYNPNNVAISTDRSVYLNNFYVKNTDKIVSEFVSWNTQNVYLTGNSIGWRWVKEFAVGIKPPVFNKNAIDYQYYSPIYIDGVRTSLKKIIDFGGDMIVPPKDLQSRHIWSSSFPSGESPGAVNVKKHPYNAVGDGVADDTLAIQNAINQNEIVFLPKGYYRVTRTINLKPDTKLIGTAKSFSVLIATDNTDTTFFSNEQFPNPLIRTADDSNSDSVVAFLGFHSTVNLPGVYAIHWRSGRNSIFRGVNIFRRPLLGYSGGSFPNFMQNFPTVLISGNGGGKWYNFHLEGHSNQGKGYRHIKVFQTSEHLNFYHFDVEHAKGEAKAEFINTNNISIYGMKAEGNYPNLWVKDSNNINIFGYGGNASAFESNYLYPNNYTQKKPSLFRIENTTDFRIVNTVDYGRVSGGSYAGIFGKGTDPNNWHMILEVDPQGNEILSDFLDRPVLYKHGNPDTVPPKTIASHASGIYNQKINITLTATDDLDINPKIFYTTDGRVPTKTSKQYSAPIILYENTTLKFFAVDSAQNMEAVQTVTFNITPDPLKMWKPVPLRTQAQKDSGILGGEGMQMILGISYAPSNPNIVYLVSDTSQVWKSTDGGDTWKMKNRGFLANGGISLAVHPNNENIVFVAGSVNSPGRVYSDTIADGIYRTQNGGNNWELVKNTRFSRPSDNRGGVNFAFQGETIYAITHDEGVLKSTDGGETWTSLNKLLGEKLLDIKSHPQDNTILLIASEIGLYKLTDGQSVTLETLGNNLPALPDFPRAIAINSNDSSKIYVSVGKSGVYKSVDEGVNFSPVNNGLTPINNNKAATYLTMSSVNPEHLYVNFYKTGVAKPFYSKDGGNTWLEPETMDTWNMLSQIMPGSGSGSYYSGPTTINPVDENVAITAGSGGHPERTLNGGINWFYSSSGYTGGRVGMRSSSFSFDPNDPSRFALFLIDFGPIITTDGGSIFRKMNVPIYPRIGGAKTTPVGSLDPTPGSKTYVTAVGEWNKQVILVNNDEGTTWQNKLFDGINNSPNTEDNYSFIAFHPQNFEIIYAGSFKSTDKGKSWIKLTRPVVAIYLGDGEIVYSTENTFPTNNPNASVPSQTNIYKSVDGGITWPDTPNWTVDIGSSAPGEIAIDPENQNRIYLTTLWNGIYILENGLWTKKTIADGLERDSFGTLSAKYVTVDPNSPNIVYVGKWIAFKGHSNGIFRSTDYGETWENITYNLGSEFTPWSISVNPDNSYAYIGSSHGTWKLPPPAPPKILSISIDKTNWSIGSIESGTAKTMTNSDKITVTNNGNVNTTLSLIVTEPVGWTAGSTNSTGINQFVLSGLFTGNSIISVLSSDFNTVDSDDVVPPLLPKRSGTEEFSNVNVSSENGIGVIPGDSRYLWLNFASPTQSSVESEQTVSITVTAEIE